MKVEQHLLDRAAPLLSTGLANAQLVLVFGSAALLMKLPLSAWRALWPKACFVGCSSAGEILNDRINEQRLALTVVSFDRSQIAFARAEQAGGDDGTACGAELASALPQEGLRHVFMLCDGLACNPSALLKSLAEHLPAEVVVTGGIAADDLNFTRPLIVANALPDKACAAAVGFYGKTLNIGFSAMNGWNCFGPERQITRINGNTLYELDGGKAFELYERYLGELASSLPASALRYPLAQITPNAWSCLKTRSTLSFDATVGSIQLCGSLAEGDFVRMMRATPEHLVRAAHNAASDCMISGGKRPTLAVAVAGAGRRQMLGLRAEEELEDIKRTLGPQLALSGFYGYGEIAPLAGGTTSEVHGQSISITSFDEA